MALDCKKDNYILKSAVRDERGTMQSRRYSVCLLLIALVAVSLFTSCTSVVQKNAVLALVDDDPITEEDLKYSLTVAHRKEDLASAGSLDLMRYVNKMIDDRLLVHEARRAAMDRLPEVRRAVDAYLLRESVVRLHKDEIVDKVSVAEDEMKDYYAKNYEQFRIGIIEMKSCTEAQEMLERLKNGSDFAELVALHSSHPSKENKGELSMRRLGMSSQFYNAVSALSPGQYSDAVKLADACYILKFLSRVAPSESEFDKVKVSIQKAVRKAREAKRSDDYLQSLRIRRKVAINEGLLAELIRAAGEMDAGKIRSSESLVDVGGDVLTAGEFIFMLKQSRLKVGVEIVNNWIERKLIDQEALDRNYGKEPDLQGMLNRYENELLRQMFVQKVIQPQVTITEDKLAEYYGSHQQEYMKPGRYKIKSITVANEDDARGIEKSLAEGADFTWLAKRKSADQLSEESVERRWMSRGEFPGKAAELVDSMKIGDVSPVIRTPMGRFMIFELEDKQEGQVEGLDRVRDAVRQAYFSQQMNGLLQKYLKQLRESAETRVFKGRIQALESGLQK